MGERERWEGGEDERQVQGSLLKCLVNVTFACICMYIHVYAIKNEARLNELLSLSSDEHWKPPFQHLEIFFLKSTPHFPYLPHTHHSIHVYTCITQTHRALLLYSTSDLQIPHLASLLASTFSHFLKGSMNTGFSWVILEESKQ